MKILYGITKSNFGGAQRYVFELAVEAKRQKHAVAVLCGQTGTLIEKLNKEKIRVITLKNLERDVSLVKEIASFIEIVAVLKKERPDVFHINSSKMGGLGGLAGRLANTKKIIFTAHGLAFNEPRPGWQKILIKFFTWLTILLAHKTICVSYRTKSDVERWPFIKNKVIVIRNGIKKFVLLPREEAQKRLNLKEEGVLIVGTMAELHPIKGLDILLLAWSKFTKRYKTKLVIIGEGEERGNLENMVKKLDISDSVIFKGFINNARTLLSGFDIFVMPSRSEAMPYALLEAGFTGLPVVATPVGGIPEIIENGINGVLVPVEDVEVLFSTLVLLAEDENLRKRLGTSLKKSIQENFSFEKMVTNTLQTYL